VLGPANVALALSDYELGCPRDLKETNHWNLWSNLCQLSGWHQKTFVCS